MILHRSRHTLKRRALSSKGSFPSHRMKGIHLTYNRLSPNNSFQPTADTSLRFSPARLTSIIRTTTSGLICGAREAPLQNEHENLVVVSSDLILRSGVAPWER